jgi:hypothetical protein
MHSPSTTSALCTFQQHPAISGDLAAQSIAFQQTTPVLQQQQYHCVRHSQQQLPEQQQRCVSIRNSIPLNFSNSTNAACVSAAAAS